MSTKASRYLFAALLGMIGLVMVVFYSMTMEATSGKQIAVISKYLSPGFQIAPLIGGLGMMVLSLFIMFTNGRQVGCGHDHDHGDDGCAEDHDHGELNPVVTLLIVCLPLGVSVVYTQHDFSQEAMAKMSESSPVPKAQDRPQYTRETLDKYKSKNADGAYLMEVREMWAVAGDPTVSKVIEGLDIEVEGAVRNHPRDPQNPKVKRMYRMFMTCCAADMQAIPLKLELPEDLSTSFDFPDHTWLRVQGKAAFETDSQGIRRTVIKVEKLTEAVPPDHEILQGGVNSVMQDKM